jgi:hypothetical protein
VEQRRWLRRAALPSVGVLGSTLIALRSSAGTFEVAIFGQQPRLSAILLTLGFLLSAASAVGLILSRELVADAKVERDEALEEGRTLRGDNEALVQQVDYLQSAIEEYADDVLLAFLHAAGLGTTSRVSLFAVEYRNARLVARRSLNPALQTAARRPYPLNKGAIGQAYEHGRAYEAPLPPATDLQRWNSAQAVGHRLDLQTAGLLRMRPRSYLIVRLDDAGGAPKGLVALESEAPKEVTVDNHALLLSQGWGKVMTAVLAKIEATATGKSPDPRLAREEGF